MSNLLKYRIYDMLRPPVATKADCIRVAADLKCTAAYVVCLACLYGRLQPVHRYLPATNDLIWLIGRVFHRKNIAKAAGVSVPAVYRTLDRAGFVLSAGTVTPKQPELLAA